MTVAQKLRKQANNIGANVADMEGNSIRENLETLAAEVQALEEDAKFLSALRAAGVDNWDGYDYAFDILEEL